MKAAEVTRLIDAIDAQLKILGWWSATPLPASAYENIGPFGQNTMTFSQWLQFIFVPRVRECIAANDCPDGSMVGAYAIRELDGCTEAQHLVDLLCEFDALFD